MPTLPGGDGDPAFASAPYLAHLRDLSIGLTADEMLAALEGIRSSVFNAYAHLPQKTAAFGTDVVRELDVLADTVPYFRGEREFADQVQRVTRRLFDRHTALVMPSPWRRMVAYLPVRLEACWDGNRRVVIVTGRVAQQIEGEALPLGAEVTHWNGTPIRTYIERLSWTSEGANPDARVALALRSLTVRPLGYQPVPDEDWVTLTTRDRLGPASVTLPWRVYELTEFERRFGAQISDGGVGDTRIGLDHASQLVNSTTRSLFLGANDVRGETRTRGLSKRDEASMNPLPENLSLDVITENGRTYGYVRVFSFEHPDSRDYLAKFASVCALLPERIILDVRANPGGTIPSGEVSLQLFGEGPLRFGALQFRNTKFLRRIVNASGLFEEWRRSMNLSFDTGQDFSQAVPVTKLAEHADVPLGQRKKAVLIVDALSYSTTDYVAAGFRDNRLGPVIGVDRVTGAGGANVWGYSLLRSFEQQAGGASILPPLPRDLDFNLSVRRSLRTGQMDGIPLEGLGAEVDFFHRLTVRDVTSRNEDLLAFAARVLDRSF